MNGPMTRRSPGIDEMALADGTVHYRVRVETARDAEGRRRWLVATFATLAEAERQRARWLLDGRQLATMTLAEYLREEWLPDYGRRFAASSYRQRRVICEKWLIPYLGGVALAELAVRTLERAFAAMARDGCSAQRQAAALAVLQAALSTAVRWGYLPQHQAGHVRLGGRRGEERPRAPIFPREELARLLAARDDAYGVLWRILAGTGMRISEARALRWSDVDLERRVIAVRRTLARGDHGEYESAPKSAAGRREVLIPRWLATELARWRAECQRARWEHGAHLRPGDYVVGRVDGSPLPSGSITGQWRKTLALAQIDHGTPHHLRHTATTEQLMAGVPLKTVSARLGHSTLGLTADLYGHVLLEHQAAAAEALEGVYAPPVEPESWRTPRDA